MISVDGSDSGLALLRDGLALQAQAVRRARTRGANDRAKDSAARDMLRKATVDLEEHGPPSAAALAYAHLSGAELWCGKIDAARAAADRALELAERSSAASARAEALARLADLGRAEGGSVLVVDAAYRRAADAWREAEDSAKEGFVLAELAAYQMETGREPRAERTVGLARWSLREAGESGAARDVGRMLRAPWISRILRRL